MTDLRDKLPARPRLTPLCHPDRPHKARRLCQGCYEHHAYAGTLDQHPRVNRTPAEFVAAYTRLRARGHSVRSTAHRLGMTFDGLNRAYYRAVHAGLLTPDRRPA